LDEDDLTQLKAPPRKAESQLYRDPSNYLG
jgi:hypothetical protein